MNLKQYPKNLYARFRKELDELRVIVGTHPRVILWRLHIFGYSPFLSRHIFKIAAVGLVFFSFFFSFYIFDWRSPRPFPENALVTVERGEPLSQIVKDFAGKGVVRSPFWLRAFITLFGGQNRVIAGDYYFPKAKNIFSVAWMLHKGEFGLIPFRVTIPEGLSSMEIAEMLEKELPAFDSSDFLSEVDSGDFEGYLFPDTYFFMPNTKASDVILTMRENFARQVSTYEADIAKFEKPLHEVVIMASIIEDEANKSLADKRIISGILWKRIRMEMPMQVDAPFKYYNGKHSYTLTNEDLKEDHPYNTYINKGLPPTAISNPGIDSIRAAITPTPTDYLYFMSDKSGNLYYASDFEGHQVNRERYLR
jgi:UPF0755 protein